MERRNWSIKGLTELIYVDSLDDSERAQGLTRWVKEYLTDHQITDFDLELDDLKRLSELFFKNIDFLKKYKEHTRKEMIKNRKMKNFLENSF
jgi:hypothetical protein